MKLSAQEEYGLRCLVQVAQHEAPAPLQISEIAAAEGLSPEYVAKLMRVLRQGGLVSSTRGAGGGYHLARPADQITLQEAIVVLDGPLFPEGFCAAHTGQQTSCVHGAAPHRADCNIRTLWTWMGSALDRVLRQITLADLIAGTRQMNERLNAAKQVSPLLRPTPLPLEESP